MKFSILPSSLAWEAFGIASGAANLLELNNRIYKYKNTDRLTAPDPNIGCIILSSPFYFDQKDWIPVPADWNRNIVQGKIYDTGESVGLALFEQIKEKLSLQKELSLFVMEEKIKDKNTQYSV